MSFRRPLGGSFFVVLILASLSPQSVFSADNTWIGATSGAQSWSTGTNWSLGYPPQFSSWPYDRAIIGSATANRNISTPSTPVYLYGLQMSQAAGAGVVNTLTLQNNMNIAGAYEVNVTNDSANTPDQLVFDLNGKTFAGYLSIGWSNMTIRNSGAPGTGAFDTIYGLGMGTAVIENNVTAITRGSFFGGGSWQPGSKLIVADNQPMYAPVGGGLQDVDFGFSSSSTQAGLYIQWDTQIHGDLTIYAPNPGINPLGFAEPFYPIQLSVGGNFIDHAGPTGASYGRSTLVFNGAPASTNTVSIQRQLASNVGVRVGNSAADFGDIELAKSLTTGGAFTITNGSALNVGHNTLTVNGFTQATTVGATSIELGFDLGTPTGHVAVNGNLTLNDFILTIGGGLAGVNDIVLFTYTGNLIGTPNIVGVNIETVTGKFTYSGLQVGGGQIVLLDVEIPEPSSLGVVALAGLALLRRRRR